MIEPINVSSKSEIKYTIQMEKSFENLSESIKDVLTESKKICIVTDSNVKNIYLDTITKLLESDFIVFSYVIEAGEQSKSEENTLKILNYLCENSFHRTDALIALGGGVTGDLTGFTASLYMRGINFINIPTSLLAMVDSSIGGKTAVDFGQYKNLIGSFYMPKLVYINVNCIESLSDRQYFAGFAEIMKAALICDSEFYIWLIDNMYEICEKNQDTMLEMISRSINIKKNIVEKDPYEKGNRALLNLGHTIGHAIEIVLNDEYIHGECVALGCVAAAYISWKKGIMKMEEYYEIRDMFVPFNLPISIVTTKLDEIEAKVAMDKKNKSEGKIRMILLKKVGKAIIDDDVDISLIKEALKELLFDITE